MPLRPPLPVTMLTGFLGAGKTTLLRAILSNPDHLKIGILVNDFGEINIDAALIVESTSDSISLSNGCVCCTIQTELVSAVRNLIETRPDLDRIIIEASGVSRSIPLADLMISEEIQDIAALDGMFCLVDAVSFPEMDYASTELAIDQMTGADMIILTKTDLATDEELAGMHRKLAGLMPHLRIVPSVQGNVPLDILFGPARPARGAGSAERAKEHVYPHPNHHDHGPHCDCGASHAHEDHVSAFTSWTWQGDTPLDEMRLRRALRQLGAGLLRAKGILQVQAGDGTVGVFEFQQVGKRSRLTPATTPPDTAGSLLVAIGLSGQIDAEAMQALMEGCATAPAA